MSRLARLTKTAGHDHQTLDGFVDSLLQTFENSRPGLTAEMLQQKGRVESFFSELYEAEVRGLREKIARLAHLSKQEQQELFERVDDRIRKVVLPAYARLAAAFTPRERNDFYLTADALHAVERIGWGVAGVLLGAFVVWSPFIPIWSKEWVLVFGLGGLVFPSLRRYVEQRRYEHQLNDLVVRTDDEIWRLDLGYLASAWERGASAGGLAGAVEEAPRRDVGPEPMAAQAERDGGTNARNRAQRTKEGH